MCISLGKFMVTYTRMSPETNNLPSRYLSTEEILSTLDHLPVANLRDDIRLKIINHQNLVLVGETGSGKSTCFPPLLNEYLQEQKLPGICAVTQPRRIAARTVCDRVSQMHESEVGTKVGYHVRFDEKTSQDTDIVYMTDGILLRKIQFDPLLLEYSVVMVDEAHERSLNIDLCLGLLKEVNQNRLANRLKPIKIVIASATIDSGKFARYLDDKDQDTLLEIPGKIFPVDILYLEKEPGYQNVTQLAANLSQKIISESETGDILIFMPGKGEIKETIESLKGLSLPEEIDILPFHAELQPSDQDKVFLPSEKRKVIIATNVAETSVTIDGVRFVIDSGLIKQNQFDSHSGTKQLVLTEHALSGINQRAGRAGRTAPGVCYRLFTENSLRRRPKYPTPEIQRSNLDQVILTMKKVGIDNPLNFDFIDKPQVDSVRHSLESLTEIDALDQHGYLTGIGEKIIDLGVEPRLARMIIEATKVDPGSLADVCTLTSLMEGKNVFVQPEDYYEAKDAQEIHRHLRQRSSSDFLVLLRIWEAFAKNNYSEEWATKNYLNEKVLLEAKNVREDVLERISQGGLSLDLFPKSPVDPNLLGQIITSGIPRNLLVATDHKHFAKIDGTKSNIFIHPSSSLYSQNFKPGSIILAGDIFVSPSGKTFASICHPINKRQLSKDTLKQLDQIKTDKSQHQKSRRKYKGKYFH